jgi:hypothetical protein
MRPSLHTYFDYGILGLPDQFIRLTVDMTSRKSMLTLPGHMIQPLVYPAVRICQIILYSLYVLVIIIPLKET